MFRTNSNIGAILGYGGYANSIFNSYSQLSSIRSNAYSKLAKAYSRTSGNNQLQNMSAYNRLRTPANNAQTAIRTVGNEAAELTSSAKVLTDTGKNSLLGNKPFAVKLDGYADGVLQQQKEIDSCAETGTDGSKMWTVESIKRRQERIVEWAMANWDVRKAVE